MEIKENIINWTAKRLKNFTFREHQLETICNLIEKVINPEGIKNQIIEAPTGSGKSIICLIAAGVLADCYGLKSYILVSDLYLWQQYADFIENNNLNFGYLKGLTGNYICERNGEDMRNAECRIANISYNQLFHKNAAKKVGYGCAMDCQYIQERKRAVQSDVTVLTYHLYHYQINILKEANFERRDILFCDECHNIPDIVQNICTPCVQIADLKHILGIWEYINEQSKPKTLFDKSKSYSLLDKFPRKKSLENKFKHYLKEMSKENTPEKDWELFYSYMHDFLFLINDTCDAIEKDLEEKRTGDVVIPLNKNDIMAYKNCSYIKNHVCILEDFYTSVSKTVNDDNKFFIKNITNEEFVSFSCTKEDFMVWYFILKNSTVNIMLSATVGLKEAFDDNIGIRYTTQKTSEMNRIPSTFDFSKSPIYIIDKCKLTFKEKERSFPIMQDMVYKILKANEGLKGMIQTGSYENAKRICENAPKEMKYRFLIYKDSKEKEQLIERHKIATDTVLIGPSLTEGIDLPGELCRFIVIFKVPFPQLQDKLVQAKMKQFPMWYKSKTSNSIIQGIGRGNRYKDDWCKTYIIDGCFKDLFMSTSSQYSEELKKRMKIYR